MLRKFEKAVQALSVPWPDTQDGMPEPAGFDSIILTAVHSGMPFRTGMWHLRLFSMHSPALGSPTWQ